MMQGPSPGSLLWARAAGGADDDEGSHATAAPGGFAVTGAFGGAATFGAEGNSATLTAVDIEEAFVARYDAAGELLWARSGGGSGADHGHGLAQDGSGDTFATGSFSAAAIFGLGEATQATLTSVGSLDLFLARYDADGGLRWARSAGSFYGHDIGQSLVLADGGVLLCGSYTDVALFDQGGPNATMLLGPGLSDILLARYGLDGSLDWVKGAGGTGQDSALSMTPATGGGAFVVGRFEGMATFGEGTAQATLTSAGQSDVFVARYGADGTLAWAQRAGGVGHDEAVWVATSGGQILIAGSFAATADFGLPSEAVSIDSSGGSDVFLAAYEEDGSLAWVVPSGGAMDETAHGAALIDDGAVLTGSFVDSAVFGRGEAAETTLETAGGETDAFVATFEGDGALRWARAVGGAGVDAGLGVTVLDDAIVATGRFGATATFGAGQPGEVQLGSSGASDIFLAAFVK